MPDLQSTIDEDPIVDLEPVLSDVIRPQPPALPPPLCGCYGGGDVAQCDFVTHSLASGTTPCSICRTRIPLARICRTRHEVLGVGGIRCPDCLAGVPFCRTCFIRAPGGVVACACRPPARPPAAYHSGRRAPAVAAASQAMQEAEAGDDPLIGFEIEVMPRAGSAHPDRWGAILDACGGWLASLESDASLGDRGNGRGAECVTIPLPMAAWEVVLADVYASILPRATAENEACGGHIHVSILPDLLVGARVVAATYCQPAQQAVWAAVADRPMSPMCHDWSPNGTAIRTRMPHRADGHPALCIGSGDQTIEWRQPAGTDDPRVALGRAEILIDVLRHAAAYHEATPAVPWGWGVYLRDRPYPTPDTRYAFALLRSVGF